jgi:hypothetical protein
MTDCKHDWHLEATDYPHDSWECKSCQRTCLTEIGKEPPRELPGDWIGRRVWELEGWPMLSRGEPNCSKPSAWEQAIMDYLDCFPPSR